MSDEIKFYCPKCDAKLSVVIEAEGVTCVCPYCSEQITIPIQKAALRGVRLHFSQAVRDLAGGKIYRPDVTVALKKILVAQYDPKTLRGTPDDLQQHDRILAFIETNLAIFQKSKSFKMDYDPDVMDGFPACELKQMSEVPEKYDWQERWELAGGTLIHGRMVALMGDPIWCAISDFGLPYAPFAVQSGFDTENLARSEAESLGLAIPRQLSRPIVGDSFEVIDLGSRLFTDYVRMLADRRR